MYKILVIEDDENLRGELVAALEKWQFDVYCITDFSECLNQFMGIEPQLVLMDVNLPVYDGFYWCGKIRDVSKVPILFLSSRDADSDMVMAMRLGGDDYVTKPFSMDVLLVKIQAILRRNYDYKQEDASVMILGGLILLPEKSRCQFENEVMDLTRNELKILTALVENKGKVVTRQQLMHVLWDDDQFVNENTLTVNINRLRHKLKTLTGQDFITTKKGQGYQVNERVQ